MKGLGIACGLAVAALALSTPAVAVEPLSNAGMSDSFVSDLPPQLAACQAITQEPESGHSGGKGSSPCPVITTVLTAQGLPDSQIDASLSGGPRVISSQDLIQQRQLFDALVQAAAALSGVSASVQTPFSANGNTVGSGGSSPFH